MTDVYHWPTSRRSKVTTYGRVAYLLLTAIFFVVSSAYIGSIWIATPALMLLGMHLYRILRTQ